MPPLLEQPRGVGAHEQRALIATHETGEFLIFSRVQSFALALQVQRLHASGGPQGEMAASGAHERRVVEHREIADGPSQVRGERRLVGKCARHPVKHLFFQAAPRPLSLPFDSLIQTVGKANGNRLTHGERCSSQRFLTAYCPSSASAVSGVYD